MTHEPDGIMAEPDHNEATTIVAPRPSRFAWDAFGLTDTGRVRRANEDAFFVHSSEPLWVVADGMGGHSAGDIASSSIAKAFELLRVPQQLSVFADLAEATLLDLNAKFRELADFGRGGATIGSTVVVLAARGDYVLFLWVGDSRIYRSRRGVLQRLTEDHSQVEELIAMGALLRENAESFHGANVVTRAVGATDDLYVDMDYRTIADGDRFLLCSDGLTKDVSDAEIAEILATGTDAEGIARRLMERALGSTARDNVTVVVAVARDLGGRCDG